MWPNWFYSGFNAGDYFKIWVKYLFSTYLFCFIVLIELSRVESLLSLLNTMKALFNVLPLRSLKGVDMIWLEEFGSECKETFCLILTIFLILILCWLNTFKWCHIIVMSTELGWLKWCHIIRLGTLYASDLNWFSWFFTFKVYILE